MSLLFKVLHPIASFKAWLEWLGHQADARAVYRSTISPDIIVTQGKTYALMWPISERGDAALARRFPSENRQPGKTLQKFLLPLADDYWAHYKALREEEGLTLGTHVRLRGPRTNQQKLAIA